MIEKGRWIPASVDWANSNGVSLPLEARPMLKGGRQIISLLQMGIFNLVLLVPWQLRVRFINQLRKLFISY